jgi:hypothetical protein
MLVSDLLPHFRVKLVELGRPIPFEPLLISYLNNAYQLFVNGIEGVADELEVAVLANDVEIDLPSSILKIKSAQNAAGDFIEVINRGDTRVKGITFGTPGEIRYLLLGAKANAAKVADSPEADTTISLDVDRLPLTPLTLVTDNPVDVAAKWHLNLVDGALARALQGTPDPQLNRLAKEFESNFAYAINSARKEKSRAKSKITRTVRYGGI